MDGDSRKGKERMRETCHSNWEFFSLFHLDTTHGALSFSLFLSYFFLSLSHTHIHFVAGACGILVPFSTANGGDGGGGGGGGVVVVVVVGRGEAHALRVHSIPGNPLLNSRQNNMCADASLSLLSAQRTAKRKKAGRCERRRAGGGGGGGEVWKRKRIKWHSPILASVKRRRNRMQQIQCVQLAFRVSTCLKNTAEELTTADRNDSDRQRQRPKTTFSFRTYFPLPAYLNSWPVEKRKNNNGHWCHDLNVYLNELLHFFLCSLSSLCSVIFFWKF